MKTLLELEDADCRWPVGRPEWTLHGLQEFCAAPRIRGKSYCSVCCDLAYAPPPTANGRSAVDAEKVAA